MEAVTEKIETHGFSGNLKPVTLAVGAASDIGLKRSHNEDSFCVEREPGLFIICDGMGGHNAGEVASRLAVEFVRDQVLKSYEQGDLVLRGRSDPNFSPGTNLLAGAIRLANERVYASASGRSDYEGMGTTIVAALLTGPLLSIAHVGDSRLYLIREGALAQLTADHSFVGEQLRRGVLTEEEADRSPYRNIITRAVGIAPRVVVTLDEFMLLPGDRLLLCSDGLTTGVRPAQILGAIQAAKDPQTACDDLVGLANRAGGEDNTTVIVIIITGI